MNRIKKIVASVMITSALAVAGVATSVHAGPTPGLIRVCVPHGSPCPE